MGHKGISQGNCSFHFPHPIVDRFSVYHDKRAYFKLSFDTHIYLYSFLIHRDKDVQAIWTSG